MSGEKELKPCPFCGSHANRMKYPEPHQHPFQVVCSNVACYVETPNKRTIGEAEEQWNRRATPLGTELVPEGVMAAIREAAPVWVDACQTMNFSTTPYSLRDKMYTLFMKAGVDLHNIENEAYPNRRSFDVP